MVLDIDTWIVHEKDLPTGIIQCVQQLYDIRLRRGGMRPPRTRDAAVQATLEQTQPYTQGQHIAWVVPSHSPDLRLPTIVECSTIVQQLRRSLALHLSQKVGHLAFHTQLTSTRSDSHSYNTRSYHLTYA